MASYLFVNALQVEFESVLAMEHTEMARMFKYLVDTGLEGFLAASGSVYETDVAEYFANARVIRGTIVSFVANRKLAMVKEIFAEAFGIPTEGATSFLDVPKDTVVLVNMVNNPKRQSQGFAVQVSVLLENLVKADLGESVKLHPQKVLTNKSVQTYIKTNLDVKPTGETSKQIEDTASGTEGGQYNITKLVDMQVETQVEKNKKKAASKKKKAEEPTMEQNKKKKRLSHNLVKALKYQLGKKTIAGEQEATTVTPPELEKPIGDESIGCGPEGHVRIADQEVLTARTDSNAKGHDERMQYETQTDQGGQDENVFSTAQDEQEKSTGGCPEGTTFDIEDWVEKAD
ncbi:hypothetical protein F511_39356 [Dorcoceras hygrometricum]|uniref:Uncharacterized protein n=1 Tax=Dorcoceras hygrometricum TaxID=472368 RepID=A0A2Z7AF93_9LAMI|nr:hypothetical protein F511_39356 [Dorcoceras hygrometricum]